MQLRWEIEDQDIARVKSLLSDMADDPFVKGRQRWNLAKDKGPVGRDDAWYAMVLSRITSQQRSGPNTPVGRFLITRPSPLALDKVLGADNPEVFIEETIRSFGGVRFSASCPIPRISPSSIPRNLRGSGGETARVAMSHPTLFS